jgi:hypothetical protein
MKKETRELIRNLLDVALEEEEIHQYETIMMFGKTDDEVVNRLRELLKAKIDLLQGDKGLERYANKIIVQQDLERCGLTMEDLKESP